jgi:PEP-CTERM motif
MLVALGALCLLGGVPRDASAEVIELFGPGGVVQQGDIVEIQVVLRENTTNLVSYSLDVDIVPSLDAFGDVAGDAPSSNFFDSRNLILNDPDDSLDGLFSLIVGQGDGGVFFNAQSASGTPVDLAIDGFSDGLGIVSIVIPDDAFGEFEISLGSASNLYDGRDAVSFASNPLIINVVPEPSALGLLALVMIAVARRRGVLGHRRSV